MGYYVIQFDINSVWQLSFKIRSMQGSVDLVWMWWLILTVYLLIVCCLFGYNWCLVPELWSVSAGDQARPGGVHHRVWHECE